MEDFEDFEDFDVFDGFDGLRGFCFVFVLAFPLVWVEVLALGPALPSSSSFSHPSEVFQPFFYKKQQRI